MILQWPKEKHIKQSATEHEENEWNLKYLIWNKFPVLNAGWLSNAEYTDSKTQNAFYDWYTENVPVTDLFVFDAIEAEVMIEY